MVKALFVSTYTMFLFMFIFRIRAASFVQQSDEFLLASDQHCHR